MLSKAFIHCVISHQLWFKVSRCHMLASIGTYKNLEYQKLPFLISWTISNHPDHCTMWQNLFLQNKELFFFTNKILVNLWSIFWKIDWTPYHCNIWDFESLLLCPLMLWYSLIFYLNHSKHAVLRNKKKKLGSRESGRKIKWQLFATTFFPWLLFTIVSKTLLGNWKLA